MVQGKRKHIRIDNVSQEEALGLGLGSFEWDLINKGLGASPNRAQFLSFLLCWSEEISKKSSKVFFKDLNKLSTKNLEKITNPFFEDSGCVSINEDKELVLISTDKNFLSNVSFKLSSEELVNSLLSRLLELNATPEFFKASIHLGKFDSLYNQQALKKSVTALSESLNNISLPFFPLNYNFSKEFDKISIFNGIIAGQRNKPSEGEKSPATKPGDIVFYIGLPTLREGLNNFGDKNLHQNVPRVDLFYLNCLSKGIYSAYEKKLINSLISLEDSPFAVSLVRLANKISSGLEFDLSKVPSKGEIHFLDILLSQTHHRFIGTTSKRNHRVLSDHFLEHGIDFNTVGQVQDSDDLEILWEHKTLSNLPYSFIFNSAPYRNYSIIEDPPILKSDSGNDSGSDSKSAAKEKASDINNDIPKNYQSFSDLWLDMLACPFLTSNSQVVKNFDFNIGARGVGSLEHGLDSVFLSNNDDEVFSISLNSYPLYSVKDSYLAASHSFASSSRELSALGLEIIGASSVFNGGNLNSFKDVADFSEMVNAAVDLSKEWNVPYLTSSSSVYNGTRKRAIPATSSIGLIGKQKSTKEIIKAPKLKEGDKLIFIGKTFNEPGSSVYLKYIHGTDGDGVPEVNIFLEKKTCNLVSSLKSSGLVKSALSVSFGGYVLALSKLMLEKQGSFSGANLGAKVSFTLSEKEIEDRGFDRNNFREDYFLLGESAGRFILAVSEENYLKVVKRLESESTQIEAEGEITGKDFIISGLPTDEISIGLKTIKKVWQSGF